MISILENLLEANAEERPKLDVHLGVCRVVAHVDRLHCLGTADRGRSCTSYCLLQAKNLHTWLHFIIQKQL